MNRQESLEAAIAECQPQNYIDHIKTIFFWYDAWFHTEDFNGCMFQKAVEEISKLYPSTIRPAIEYKEWLTGKLKTALEGLGIQQAIQLATLLASLLDGMTIQAQIDTNTVKIEDYWTRVQQLIQLELLNA